MATREKDRRYKGGYVCRLWKQRREEMAWEVEQNHLTNVEREPRERRSAGVCASSLAWKLKRNGGHLRKLLRSLKGAGK